MRRTPFFQISFSDFNTAQKWATFAVSGSSSPFPFTPQEWVDCCKNRYQRFAPNPPIGNYALLQQDPTRPHIATAHQFDFSWLQAKTNLVKISDTVPNIQPTQHLRDFKNSTGAVLLQGKTNTGVSMIGKPLCKIDFTPTNGKSNQYTFYSFVPPQYWQPTPIKIPRFIDKTTEQLLRKKIPQEKDIYKKGKMTVVNKDVSKRMEIIKRDPEQNIVMGFLRHKYSREEWFDEKREINKYQEKIWWDKPGWRAVDESWCCARTYKDYLHPDLITMLEHSAEIMHLKTLESKKNQGVRVGAKTEEIAHSDRLLRTEWLHLLAYSLHPMKKKPQCSKNLGAARACDNTRMMLLEYTARWFALNIRSSKNLLEPQFKMLVNTHVIDTINLSVTIEVNNVKFTLTQEIDALAPQPDHIHGSDLAGLIAVLNFLMHNVQPLSKQVIEVNSTAPVAATSFFAAQKKQGSHYYPIGHSANTTR